MGGWVRAREREREWEEEVGQGWSYVTVTVSGGPKRRRGDMAPSLRTSDFKDNKVVQDRILLGWGTGKRMVCLRTFD
jgi:hypothetical protein